MTELKTLKDMESVGETHGFREKWYSEKELRQEAIKHYKLLKKAVLLNKATKKQEVGCVGGMTFIKIFFNITEEDLK